MPKTLNDLELNGIQIDSIYNVDINIGLKYISDSSIDLIITDPPYEVKYNEKSKHLAKLGKARDKQIERDSSFEDVILDHEFLAVEMFRILKPDTHCYIFCGDKQITKWSQVMQNAGFKAPQVLVWKKENCTFDMTMGHKFPENKEFCLFFHKGWKKLNGYDIYRDKFRSVLEFKASEDTKYHSCAKPIPLLKFLMELSSNENEVCLDLFGGSGNHLITFKNHNRRFIGFELSKDYALTIAKRLKEIKAPINKWYENE